MKALLAPVLSVCLSFGTDAGAQPGGPTCYGLPEGADTLQAQSLSITSDGRIALVLPGAPHVLFEQTCTLDASGTADCRPACDGGRVVLERRPEGMVAIFDNLQFDRTRGGSLVFGLTDRTGGGQGFSGRFVLVPMPAAACDADAMVLRPTLRAGAFSPEVESVELALAALGFFSSTPDWSFTAETSLAVADFQAGSGLPVTGEVDDDLLRRLAVPPHIVRRDCPTH